MAPKQRQPGYSLIDTLIASLIFLLVLGAAYTLQQASQDTYGLAEGRAALQQTARMALDRMEQDLRMAGYSSVNPCPGINPPSPRCTDQVRIATNDTVSIHADPNGTGPVYITYSLRDCTGAAVPTGPPGTTLYTLYRQVSATSFCGGDPIADGVDSFQITYYEGNNLTLPYPTPSPAVYQLDGQGAAGAGTPTAPAPGGQRDSVRQMKIKLVLRGGSATQPQEYTTTSEVALRNLLP